MEADKRWAPSSQEEIFAGMVAACKNDLDWFDLKNLTASYFAGHDVADIAKEAFTRHIGDNVLHQHGLHLSIRQYEQEVLALVLGLFNAPDEATGTITTGGSESIMLALKTARDRARILQPQIETPEIVIPQSAYAVFNKACHLLGLKLVQMESSPNFHADVAGMEAAINENTIMLVGSAPPFPYGVVDPIPELAKLAKAHGLWLHVDACIGGFMLPFAKALGEPMPDFDFSVDGVTSISCDFHKYGYAYRGCSIVLLRDAELEKYQGFSTDAWPAGDYFSKNIVGSRNGGPIASAWAVMNYLGYDGYVEITRQLLAARQQFFDQIEETAGATLIGQPQGPHFAFAIEDVDIHVVLDGLMARGWGANIGTKPDSVIIMLSYHHGAAAEAFGNDLRAVLDEARSGQRQDKRDEKVYGIY